MTTSSDRYSGETGIARINGVIDYLLELQGEVDNDERQHLEIMIADLRQAVMCVRAAEYRAKCAVEERDDARRAVCCSALPSDYKEWKPEDVDSAVRLIAAQQGWDCFKEER